MEKLVGSALELSTKRLFSLVKYSRLKIWVANSAFAIQHKGNRKSPFEVDFEKKSADHKNVGENFPGGK